MFAACFLILITGSEKKVCAETVDTFSMNLTVTEYYDRANQVLDYVNEERKRLGAQPLTLDANLQEAAMQRAAEQYVLYGHTRPDGSPSITVDATGKNGRGKTRRWVARCFQLMKYTTAGKILRAITGRW